MTRNEFWLFLFANWRTEFENSLVLLSRVNNTFCVDFYLHNHLFDDSSSDDSELDAHTEALRDIPCRVIITNSWTHLWLANHKLLWSPTKYLNERTINTSNHANCHAQQSSMLERCPIVSEHTYHALRLGTCVFSTQSYESTFILKMKKTFKWNVNLLGVAYRDCKWSFCIWEELQKLTLKWKNDALFISQFLRTRRVWYADALPLHVNVIYCGFSHL